MHTRARRILAALTMAALAVLIPTAAHATEPAHHIDVVWATPATSAAPIDGANIWPQTIATADTCGVWLQVDRYLNDETTAALIAGGHLDGPNNPTEHLDYDHPFASTGSPWEYRKAPDCTVTPDFDSSVTTPVCTDGKAGTVTLFLADSPRYGWQVDGVGVSAGTRVLTEPGDHVVTAVLTLDGYTFGDATHSWTVTVAAPVGPCPTEEPTSTPTPTDTPSSTDEPTPTDNPTSPHGNPTDGPTCTDTECVGEPTPEPSATPTAVITPPDDNPTPPIDRVSTPIEPLDGLAETGSNTAVGILVGGLAIAAGVALLLARKAARR